MTFHVERDLRESLEHDRAGDRRQPLTRDQDSVAASMAASDCSGHLSAEGRNRGEPSERSVADPANGRMFHVERGFLRRENECQNANKASGVSSRLVAKESAPRGRGDDGHVASKQQDDRTPSRRDLQRLSESARLPSVGDLGKTTCQPLPLVVSGGSTR